MVPYVNYLLKFISEDNSILFECYCYKNGEFTGIVDNAINFQGKIVLVEVKLSIKVQSHLAMQFNKYTGANYIKPQNGKGKKLYNKLFTDKILVIDTENLYVYDGNTGQLKIIENLKNIKYINEAKRKNIFITFHVILEKL